MITFLQSLIHGAVIDLNTLLKSKEVLFNQSSRIHVTASVHQIMGLIYEEYVVALLTLSKESLEIYMGIKEIVVITYNSICKKADIQA